MTIKPYIQIARIDHWFKNVFILPGTVLAIYADPSLLSIHTLFDVVYMLLITGLVASSNYTLNEILDAPYDALHPKKKYRPVPSGKVNIRIAYFQWIILAIIGLGLSISFGRPFFFSCLMLWIMGCIYNVPPVRSKEKPYLDVLSESVNNPLRLLIGWYGTGVLFLPPVSLLIAYWMLGAFFMAVKRFAELRWIGDQSVAKSYRASFGYYTEERLLVSINYYGVAFGLFFGIFLIRYKMNLILSVPLIAGFISWYFQLGFKENSPAQNPEKLILQKDFIFYTFTCAAVMLTLLFVDFPLLSQIFVPTLTTQGP